MSDCREFAVARSENIRVGDALMVCDSGAVCKAFGGSSSIVAGEDLDGPYGYINMRQPCVVYNTEEAAINAQ